jgi:hypothetical protein
MTRNTAKECFHLCFERDDRVLYLAAQTKPKEPSSNNLLCSACIRGVETEFWRQAKDVYQND